MPTCGAAVSTAEPGFQKLKAGEAIGDCIKRLGDLLHVKISLTPVLPANTSWRIKAGFTKNAGKKLLQRRKLDTTASGQLLGLKVCANRFYFLC
jgi:hypothetical protein